MLVTYRPEALRRGHPVNTFLERAERRAHALQLRLEPLRRDEVLEYIAVFADVLSQLGIAVAAWERICAVEALFDR